MRTWLLTFIAGLLLIAPTQADEKVVFTSNRTGNVDIFVMAPDGTKQTNVTKSSVTEEFPFWSPTGTKIIFTRANSTAAVRDNIYTINPNGSGLATTVIGGSPLMPSFHPSGTSLLFSRSSGNDYDVYTSDGKGKNQVAITSDTYGDYYARWSPNGGKFTYHTFNDIIGGGTTPDIYFANPDGSGKVRITTSGGNQNASWSPDGGSIVFESSRDGNNEIYTMSPYGTTQTRLTNNTASDTAPVFSPDGRKIMFVSNRDGNNEIYVMNADGTGQTRITNNTYDDNYPNWTQVLAAKAPTVNINDVTLEESNGGTRMATFIISLSAKSSKPVNVTYRTFDGTAVATSDYVAVPPTTVTFAAGQTTKTINVLVNGDTLHENTENFSVRISAIGAKIGKQQGIATITNDDSPPSLSIADLTLPEGNANGIATARVTMNNISALPVTVNYATSNGSALAGSDYITKSGTLTFAPGETTATIPVDIIGDLLTEPDENFYITLTNAVNATIAINRGTITITNDDLFPTLSVNNVTVPEGGNAQFTISLSEPSQVPVQFRYRTTNGTAVAGSDYNALNSTLVIPAGQTSTTVTVTTLTDSLVEPAETFNLVLSESTNANIINDTGVGTIINTTAPTFYVSDVQLKEGDEGGVNSFYFTIALKAPLNAPVELTCRTADGTATAGSDYLATTQSLVMPAGSTSTFVIVPVFTDTVVESNETFLLNVTAKVGNGTSTVTGIGTIVNDDEAISAKPAALSTQLD